MPDKISDKNENPNGYQELKNPFKYLFKYIEEYIKSFLLNTDKEHVAKAKQFLELAEKDVEATKLLLKSKNYALAIFHLEQSAEKTEKAIELF
ncbi:MAG: HEPN domain-containing protein, partial [Nitrososphaeria archaeon]